MNILGMGPLEILLIVVLALIVFGPAKLPEIMGQVGRAVAEFRRTTSQLSDEFNRTIQAELQETRAIVDDTKSAVVGVHTSINSAITGTPAPVLTAAPGDSAAAPNGTATADAPRAEVPTTGINGTNGTGPAHVEPPSANTTQWSWETAAPAPTGPVASAASELPVTPRPRKLTARDELQPPY